MNFSNFVLCALLCFKVAASNDFVTIGNIPTFTTNATLSETPKINAVDVSSTELLNEQTFTGLGTPEFSTASIGPLEHLRAVNEGRGGGSENEGNMFGINQYVTKYDNSNLIDLLVNYGIGVNASDNRILETPRDGNYATIEGSDNPKVSSVSGESAQPEVDFDIISGGTFAVDSVENNRDERAMEMEMARNEIADDNLLINMNELPSDRFKNLDEILAEASRIDAAYDWSKQTEEKKSHIKKRLVDFWSADDNVELEAIDGGKETGDTHHDLVRTQVISLLDGRSLEEVTRDRKTMKNLMPLLKLLRGKPVGTKHDHEGRVEDNGTQAKDETVPLGELPPGDENNASIGVDEKIGSEAYSDMGQDRIYVSHRDGIKVGNTGTKQDDAESPAGENYNENSHGKHQQNDETFKTSTENVSEGFQNAENIMKINDTYMAEVKRLMPGNDSIKDSTLYKDFNEAVKDTLLNEILDQKTSHTKNDLGYETLHDDGDGFIGQSINKSVSEDINNGDNRTNNTVPNNTGDELQNLSVIEYDNDDDEHSRTSDDIIGKGIYNEGNNRNGSDLSETHTHQSNEKIPHHRHEKTRRRKQHKHVQGDKTGWRNEHSEASGALTVEGEDVAHSSGAGIGGQTGNATDSVVDEHAAIVGGDSADSMNATEHRNENTENSTISVPDHDATSSNIEQNLEIKQHSERRHHNKKMHKKTKEAHKQTNQNVDKGDLRETPADDDENEDDTSLSSLLGEVLKSVSIYEVHGDVGQINIKTDSPQDIFESSFDDEHMNTNEGHNQTNPTEDGSIATGNKTGNVDANSDSDTPASQNLTRTTENDHLVDQNAQINHSTNVHDQSKQVPVAGNLPMRKPYFKLLGYTKATPIVNNTSNQTENKNGAGNSIESKVMVVTNFENSSNSTSIEVHESKSDRSSENIDDEENNVNYSKMLEDELYDYEEKETSPTKEFKRESDMADDHPHDDDDDNDEDEHDDGSNEVEDNDNDGNIQDSSDGQYEASSDHNKGSDSVIDEDGVDYDDNRSSEDDAETDNVYDDINADDEDDYHEDSSDDDNKGIDSDIDEYGIDDDDNDDDEVEYHEGSSDEDNKGIDSDIHEYGIDDDDNDDDEVEYHEGSSDEDNKGIDSDIDEDGVDVDDDDNDDDEVEYHEGSSNDNKSIDSDIDEDGVDEDDYSVDDGSDNDVSSGDDSSANDSSDDDSSDDDDSGDDDSSDYDDTDIDEDDVDADNNGSSDDDNDVDSKEGDNGDDIDNEAHEEEDTSRADSYVTNIPNKNAFRRRIRYRGGPINGTRLRKGLRLWKYHGNVLGGNRTGLRKLVKVRRENKQNLPINATDLIRNNQNHGLKHSSDLLAGNGFVIGTHTLANGKNKTGYKQGLEIHHISNETSMTNSLTDVLTNTHTSSNNTNNDDGTGNNVLKLNTTSHNANTSNETAEAKVGGNHTLDDDVPVPSVSEELKNRVANIDRHHNQSGQMEFLKNVMGSDGKLTGDQDSNLDSPNNTSLKKPNSENTSSCASIEMKLDNPQSVLIYCSTLIILNLFS